jgi:glutathione synthase
MRFVYLMDPMAGVLPDKDTSFAFQRAAQARGHVALHALPRDLYVKDGDIYARVRPLTVSAAQPHYNLASPFDVRLAEVEAVFIRKDPPFDSEYLYMTQLLERARGRTVLVNDPRGLREANEKLYTLHFSQHTPRTLVASDRGRIFAFLDEVGGRAVIKPLHGAGGAGVLMLTRGDKNAPSITDTVTQDGKAFAMVQEFLPGVVDGDKRVLLLDGILLGAINRVPRPEEFRSNIHVGGMVEPCEVTDAERAIIATLAPRLRQDGLFFVGLDIIAGRLTEVNVTSPTGIQELSRHLDRDVALEVIQWVERRASELRPELRSNAPPP